MQVAYIDQFSPAEELPSPVWCEEFSMCSRRQQGGGSRREEQVKHCGWVSLYLVIDRAMRWWIVADGLQSPHRAGLTGTLRWGSSCGAESWCKRARSRSQVA